MTTGELVRCPPHFRTNALWVLCDFAVVAQKHLPTQICVQNMIGGCVGNFFSTRALKTGGFLLFSVIWIVPAV